MKKKAYKVIQIRAGDQLKPIGDRLCLILGGEEISAATWTDDRKRGRYIGHMGDAMIEIVRGASRLDELIIKSEKSEIPGKGEVYTVSVTQPEIRKDATTATLALFDNSWTTTTFHKFKTVKEAKCYCEEVVIKGLCHSISLSLFVQAAAWLQTRHPSRWGANSLKSGDDVKSR
jgi:hypothetical protein